MNLEPIIQSQVSQKEKDTYHSNTYIRKLEKWYCLQGSNRETDIENRLVDMGREVERVRCMERVTWKLTLPYVKLIAKGICCMAKKTQTGVLYQPRRVGLRGRWEGSSKYMYTYG